MARLTGSNRNDVFAVNVFQLQSLQLRAGRGYDTLRVSGNGSTTLSSNITSQWRELEALDLTSFTGLMNLTVSPTLLSSSNTRALDITLADSAQLNLASGVAGVSLYGSGHVQLSHASNNIVAIKSAGIAVTGGLGNDKISASTFGNRLDGGGGNDTLTGNSGADVFVHATGGGSDTLLGFTASQDVVDLSGHGPLNFWDIKHAMSVVDGGTRIGLPNGSLFIAGVLPENLSQDDFRQDGAPIASFGSTVLIAVGTSAAEINAVLAAVPDGTTIIFANGTHVLDGEINLQRGNITLAGESPVGVTLQFAFASGTGGDFIRIGTGEKTYATVTQSDAAAGGTSLTLADAGDLTAGDVIYIYQPNTADYLAANGWNNLSMAEAASRPFREFIGTVAAVDGDVVTLADALPYDFAAGATRIFTINALEHIALRDLAVTSNLGTADVFSFSNMQAAFDGAAAISATGTSGLILSNISITDAPSTALALNASTHAVIEDITIAGSHNKGSDGNGYGILLSEAFNNSLSGLEITDMRHAIVFSAWNAETGNAISADFINRDVNFHGSPDVGNTVTVAQALLAYDPVVDPSVWSLVSSGGSNHAATDIWGDNAVVFGHGEGAGNADTIHGTNDGSYLNGHGSNDILVGGSGDDMIVGGLRRDTLTGSAGSDTFLFRMGDDLDTITDMDFAPGGDRIVIMGNVAVDGFEDLVFTQDGADLRVRYGSNSTFILKDTQLNEVDATHFVFDPQSTTFLDDWNGGI